MYNSLLFPNRQYGEGCQSNPHRNKAGSRYCDVIKIKDADPRLLFQYDLIGIGTPIFAIEPGNVRAFINNIRFAGGKHVFVFSTHGGVPKYFLPSIVPALKKRGLIVIGNHDWYGDNSELHHIYPYPTAGHPDETDLKEAEKFGIEIVDRSRRIYAGETELIPPPPPNLPAIAQEEAVSIEIINSFPTSPKIPQGKVQISRVPPLRTTARWTVWIFHESSCSR